MPSKLRGGHSPASVHALLRGCAPHDTSDAVSEADDSRVPALYIAGMLRELPFKTIGDPVMQFMPLGDRPGSKPPWSGSAGPAWRPFDNSNGNGVPALTAK